MLMQNQGILRLEAPCPLGDQLSWLPREDTSAACMSYMAQPCLLIAPDSSGHQFYSARPFTRNPLTNQLDRLSVSPDRRRDGATDQHLDPRRGDEITLIAASRVIVPMSAFRRVRSAKAGPCPVGSLEGCSAGWAGQDIDAAGPLFKSIRSRQAAWSLVGR
jgi:hypothetical protein